MMMCDAKSKVPVKCTLSWLLRGRSVIANRRDAGRIQGLNTKSLHFGEQSSATGALLKDESLGSLMLRCYDAFAPPSTIANVQNV
jgi:hypothetical protein